MSSVTAGPPGMAVLNSAPMPASYSCSRQSFHVPGLFPTAPPFVGPAVPILQIVPQGLSVLRCQPGTPLGAGGAVCGLRPGRGVEAEPGDRPELLPAPGQLEGPAWPQPTSWLWPELSWPLPSPPCAQHSLLVSSASWPLSELSSGFIFGRSGILSPYLLPSFREGVGPLGSPGDQAMAPTPGVLLSLGTPGDASDRAPCLCPPPAPSMSLTPALHVLESLTMPKRNHDTFRAGRNLGIAGSAHALLFAKAVQFSGHQQGGQTDLALVLVLLHTVQPWANY